MDFFITVLFFFGVNLFFNPRYLSYERIGLAKFHCEQHRESRCKTYPGGVGFST